MTKNCFLVGLLVSIFHINLSAQTKHTETINRTWGGYFTQLRFTDKWGMLAEAQVRTKENFVENFSQGFIRLGLTYYASDATKLTVGYAFVDDFPGDNHKNISSWEHRIYQQLQWHTKYGKINQYRGSGWKSGIGTKC